VKWLLPLALLVPGLAFAQPVANELRQGWETQHECWRDGTVEDCRGQLVERRAFLRSGIPVYLEFRDKDTLVGLAMNLNQIYVQCDKLDKSFVCEFTALPIQVPEGLSTESIQVFDDSESLMEAGVDALEIHRLNLPWEAVRVVAIESVAKVHLSVPLKNRQVDLKRARLLGAKKKERGATLQFYVVPRIFGLGR